MTSLKKACLSAGILIFSGVSGFSQTVDAIPETQTICFGATANMSATYTGPVATATTSYAISSIPYAPNPYTGGTFVTLSDDSQSGVLPIGFNFCFFGNTYNQFYIGSNGWVAFTPQPTTFTSAPIPSAGAGIPKNCIMGPWQDWHPGIAGGPYINYQTLGVAPNRRLVVSWNNCPMFSCTTTLGRFQIVIYETTNIIENYLATKPNCMAWAGGTATQGVHNIPGTIAYTVAGRNSTPWTATNEGWRYLPNGPATNTINWYRLPGPVLVGTGTAITVTPPACQVTTLYYAQVTTTGTCVTGGASDTVQVIQNNCSPCAVVAGNNGPLCVGSTLNLTASPVAGATYAWTGPNGFTSTLQNPTLAGVTTLAAGVYTVTATVASSCSSCTATTTLVVNPIPATPAPTNSGPVCSGNTLNLFCPAVAGATYSWTGPAGFTSTLQNPSVASVTAANGGIYSVTVTVAGCTSPAGTTNVVVLNTPAPPILNNNGPLCAGSMLVLTANNIAGATYAWTGPAGFTAAVRNPPPFVSTVASAGTYSCTVTVGGCTSAPATTTVVVNPMPVAPTCPNTNACFGTSVTLTASVSGPTYEWFDAASGGTLLGTGATFTTPPLTTTTTYYVHSTAAGCTGPMTTVTVTVTAAFTVDAGLDDSICSGASSTLNVVTPTGGGYTYTWNPGGMTGPSATVTPATTTTYTLDVVDAIGCTGSDMVTVYVGAPITANANGNPATCVSSCDGNGSVIAGGGFTPYIYAWTGGTSTPGISGLCAGTYTVNITDVIGCTVQDTIVIIAPTALATAMSSVTSNCGLPDGSATVVASGGVGGYTYLWTPGGQTTATATNLTPGSYCVDVTDANGCTINSCVTVTNTPGVSASITAQTNTTCNAMCDGSATATGVLGVGPYTYSWNTVPVQTTPTATGLCAGSYICTITDASGCTDTAMVTITQPAPVAVDALPPVTICIGQNTTLTGSAMGGTSPYTFDWSAPAFTGPTYTVSPVVTTTYTVSATDAAGCPSINTQTVTVTVRPPLSVNASNNVSICPGGNTTISAAGLGGDNTYTYTWMPGGMTGASQNVSPAVTTTYTVVLTDGCTTLPAVDSVTVTVLPLPTVMFSSNLISGCTPLPVNFTDLTTVVGGNAVDWDWDFGAAGTADVQNPTIVFGSAGVYTVSLTVTTDSGCVNSFTINNMITVNALPVAAFIYDPQPTTIATPTINFHDLSTDATGWYWNFGDSITGVDNFSNMMNPSHAYSDTGSYCVTLIVTNTSSCADTITDCNLYISPEFLFWIPNSFTPDGDGLNDIFMPKGEHIEEFTMRIFDRWGELTFFSTDMYNGWNGAKMNFGEVAQQDVYVYIIQIKDRVGMNHQYIGHVTIIK